MLLLLLVAVVVTARLPSARASCESPRDAYSRTARISACEAVDPDRRPAIKQFVQTLRDEKQNAFADQLLAAYRGALITVDIQQSTRRAPTALRPRGSIVALLVGLGATGDLNPDGKGDRVYFISARVPKPCATLTPGKMIVLDEQVACCDGDPNVPCLLGAGAFGSPSSTLARPLSATDAGPPRR